MSESHSPGIDDPMEFIHRGTHMHHCHQGQYVGVCKYGYRHCPAKPAIPLMTCEGCGIALEAGEGRRWADDVITCLKCSPAADDTRAPASVPVAVTEEMVTAGVDIMRVGAYRGCETAEKFARQDMRAALEAALLASGLGDGAGWVKCSERMPEPSVYVLVMLAELDGAYARHLTWDPDDGWTDEWGYSYSGMGDADPSVTHWMKIPSPPAAGG